jgi:L-threonylcarbamoyladenylate synthase
VSYVTDKFDDEVVRLLKNGGVGFIPSDTIYGLSASALNKEAVMRLHELKERPPYKPFILLISSLNQLQQLGIEQKEAEPVKKYWPGTLSAILNSPEAPDWLQLGGGTLAVRLPADKTLCELISQIGPIVSTSANPDSQTPATSFKEAEGYFDDQLDFYVDQGELTGRLPSTLVKVSNGKLEVVREGAVKIS